jgi:RNA polymerase sigma-70 factor (ECF subfamily)
VSTASTRWTVIRRAAEGVPEDRDEFVRRYGPVIRATLGARWRGTPLHDELDDAAQQVFLDCFKGALGRADPARTFRAFLFGVVRNVARGIERKRARSREQQPPSDFDLAAKEDSCATAFDRAWARALMRDAAELQLARAREIGPEAVRRHRLLALRFGEGIPIREIAARWEVDADALHREYPKAREEFKRALMDVVRELHDGPVEKECTRLLGLFS